MPLPLPLRVAAWRARRAALPVAIVVAALLVSATLRTALTPPPAGIPVLVAARDLAAGHVLTERDLTVTHLPPSAAPASEIDRATVIGRELAVPVPAALPLVPTLLAGDRFALDPPEGAVVVALTPADATTTALLRPGDRVDLVTEAGVLARAALVLEITEPDAAGLLGTAGAHVMVDAVTPAEGRALAAAPSPAPGVVLVP